MDSDWGSQKFVAEQFSKWYRSNARYISAPPEIMSREFAFLTFEGKTMFRHIGFTDESAFRRYLTDNAPSHSYYSSSYYKHPEAEMNNKGWSGADLVFDIDADHFNLECQKNHDKWLCRNCGKSGVGKPPELCVCGKSQFETETWLCENCLQEAKNETQKLLDILIQDFGFAIKEDLIVNFSGNRGYHVHVRSKNVRFFDQSARREIVDYILATGIKPEYIGFTPRGRGAKSILGDEGWRGRAGKAMYDFIDSTPPEIIRSLDLGRTLTQNLIEKKTDILKTLENNHPSFVIQKFASKDEERVMADLEKLLTKAIKQQSADIDTVVTTDIHRLIRLPNTLHGKSGWQTQTIKPEHLSDYDPLTSAVVLKGTDIRLFVRWAPKIRIGDTVYGPYEGEEVSVPLPVALFLLCKKGAKVVN
ncbi:hypothetical protein FJY84_08285 [Candidatus Bathyarchaeota archaeon]|nr:hypothetical protein [Candidatus Bathyarchaeota archaeon]